MAIALDFRSVTYLAFALNTLVIAVLVFELHQGRKERQSLALLINSRDVS